MDRLAGTQERIVFALCLLASFALSLAVHERLSWAPDDGFYAYMAERMAAGDIIHKDLQILHPGLLYFFHEFIFKLTGDGFVSLRYPLILITVLQTALAFIIGRPHGVIVAVAAALSLTAFSFVQFVNATPNWYLVFFAVLIGFIIDRMDVRSTRAIVLIGFLVGLAFLLRQLTGAFFAIAVTALLFLKSSEKNSEREHKAGLIILAALAIVLFIYLMNSSEPVGFVMFSVWPPVFLLCAALRCDVSWQRASHIILNLVAGSILAALPIVFYHVWTGTLDGLINESFIEPFTFHGLSFIETTSHFQLFLSPIEQMKSGNLWAIFGLLNWSILLVLNVLLATTVIRKTLKDHTRLPAVAVMAIFHSLVAVILEIPMYLTYIIGPVLLGLLLCADSKSERKKIAIAAIVLSVIGIVFSAGQPIERGRLKIINLQKIDASSQVIPGTSLKANAETAAIYGKLIDVVQTCTTNDDTIYVYPSNPEIYAFTGRHSAFHFVGSYFGLTKKSDVLDAVSHLQSKQGPKMIIHNVTDVYNTPLADQLFEHVKDNYRQIGKIERFEVFARLDILNSNSTCHSSMNN